MQTVKEVVTSLSASFETKSSDMETKLSTMTDRLGKLEAAALRPLADFSGIHNEQKSAAFRSFLAKGDIEEKALSTQEQEGGYLLPHLVGTQIQDAIQTQSTLRQLAHSVSISSDAIDLLVSEDEADAGWAGEIEDRAETKAPTLRKIKIPVHEMYARPRATQKLLDDARLDVESWVAHKVATKMARMENAAFVNGTGEKQPRGFLSYPVSYAGPEWGKIESFKTGNEDRFLPEGGIDVLIDTVSSLKPQYLPKATWIMSRSASAAISKLKDKNGLPLWNSDLNAKAYGTLLGYPVVICDDMPAVDNADKKPAIAFGNFQQGYHIVDRQGTRMMRDPYSAKPYIEFYTTRRVGGDVVDFNAIKAIVFTS